MNKVARLKCGTEFDLFDSMSILESALKSNVTLNYSCMAGKCDSCKVRVSSGKTAPFQTEFSLSPQDIDNGYILTCCRKAQENLFIETEDLRRFSYIKKLRIPSKVHDVKKITNDLVIVSLRLHPNSSFEYISGQYMNISYGNLTRAYSILDFDNEHKILKFFIKLYKNGKMSDYFLNQAKLGDLIQLYGPLGTFHFKDTANSESSIFFATGTGITPFYSMIKELENQKINRKITIYWGNRFLSDFIDLPKTKYIDLDLKKCTSKESTDSSYYGYIQDCFSEDFSSNIRFTPYICGSEVIIESVINNLIKIGFKKNQINYDKFLPY